MRYLLLIFVLLSSTVWAQSGTLATEKTDQIGVFEVRVQSGTLKPGDIVSITRAGKKLGEATVMSVQGSKAVVSLKGVFEAKTGDGVEFARGASAPAQPSAGTTSNPQPDQPTRGNRTAPTPRRPAPTGNTAGRRMPTGQKCPTCQMALYKTGKQVMEKGRPADEYVCDSGHSWVKTRVTNLGNGKILCPTCSMPVQANSNSPMVRNKKVMRCPIGHTFSVSR